MSIAYGIDREPRSASSTKKQARALFLHRQICAELDCSRFTEREVLDELGGLDNVIALGSFEKGSKIETLLKLLVDDGYIELIGTKTYRSLREPEEELDEDENRGFEE